MANKCIVYLTCGDIRDICNAISGIAYIHGPSGEYLNAHVNEFAQSISKKLNDMTVGISYSQDNQILGIELTEDELNFIEENVAQHAQAIYEDTNPNAEPALKQIYGKNYTNLLVKIMKLRGISESDIQQILQNFRLLK